MVELKKTLDAKVSPHLIYYPPIELILTPWIATLGSLCLGNAVWDWEDHLLAVTYGVI